MASDRLQLQVILQAIDRATAPLKRITGGSQDAGRALKAARERLKELGAQQKAVGEFREMRIGLNAAEQALGKAQTRVRELAQGLGQAGPPTKAMARELAQARKEAAAASDTFKRKQVQTQQLRDRLTAAGISAGNLAAQERKLRGDVQATNAEIERQTAALRRQGEQHRELRRLKDQHAKAMMHTGMAGAAGLGYYEAGKRAVRTVTSPVGVFSQHEQAMLGIARQVPGARNELGQLTPVYRAIEEQIRQLSHEVPVATTAIAEMFTAAARMEVPTEQLKEFTLTASMMATAFDAVPDEITEAMGKVAKNFKLPLTQIEGLADSINFLDDNAISKGADIIDFLNRTSGVVSTVAMSAKDAAALGSTLLTLGERTETAGTAANAIVQKFAAAEKGTKKFQSAIAEIGLKSADVQAGMSTDATATLMRVIDAVRRLPKDKQIGVMVELVGMEHSDTLAKLVDKPEELRRQLDMANSRDAEGSMRREAGARNATLDAQWQMTKNRMFNATALMGETLRPAVLGLMQAINPMLERVTAWIKANPTLVAGVLKLAALLAAVVAAGGALTFALAMVVGKLLLVRFVFARAAMAVLPLASLLKGPLATGLALAARGLTSLGAAGALFKPVALAAGLHTVRVAVASLGTALFAKAAVLKGALVSGLAMGVRGLAALRTAAALLNPAALAAGLHVVRTAVMGLGATLLANPITWIVLAIAAGALLILKYWSPIKAFFGGLWDGLRQGLTPLGAAFSAALAPLQPLFNAMRPAWDWFLGVLGAVWNRVSQLLTPLQATQSQLMGAASAGQFFGQVLGTLITVAATLPQRFMTLGQDIVRGLINGIASMTGALVDAVKNMGGSALAWFKDKLGIRSPSRVFALAGAEIPAGAAQGIVSGESRVRKAALGIVAATLVGLPTHAVALHRAQPPAVEAPAVEATQVTADAPMPAAPGPDAPRPWQPRPQALYTPPPATPTLPVVTASKLVAPARAQLPEAVRAELDVRPIRTVLDALQPARALARESAPTGEHAVSVAPRIDHRPPLAAKAAAAPGPAVAGNTIIQITINPAPGMDPAAIGRAVAAELDRRERAKRSRTLSALGDID